MNKLYSFFIVLYPILSAYSFIFYKGLDLGSAILALLAPLVFIFGKKNDCAIPKFFPLFFIYVLFDSIVLLGNLPLRIILYSIILFAGCRFVDKDFFVKAYNRVCFVSSFFFLLQLFFSIIGLKISGIVSFLPTIYDGIDMVTQQKELNRFSSFFLEPSYFAQFLMPYLCIKLFDNSFKKNISNAVFITLIILLSRSGNGAILLILIWGVWFFRTSLSKKKKIGILIVGGCVAAFLLYTTDVFSYFIERTSELSFEQGVGSRFKSSGFLRLFNGYFFYGEMPLINQIIGVNPNYFSDSSIYDGSFINGVATILIMNGLLGLLLFFPHIIYLFKKSDLSGRVVVLGMSFLLLSESLYLSSRMLLYTILLVILSNKTLYIKLKQHENSK